MGYQTADNVRVKRTALSMVSNLKERRQTGAPGVAPENAGGAVHRAGVRC